MVVCDGILGSPTKTSWDTCPGSFPARNHKDFPTRPRESYITEIPAHPTAAPSHVGINSRPGWASHGTPQVRANGPFVAASEAISAWSSAAATPSRPPDLAFFHWPREES